MVRMRHRDGERIGGVVARRIGLRQQHVQHQPDLLLFAVAGANDGLLHQIGSIFRHRNPEHRGQKTGPMCACLLVAQELGLEESTVEKIWEALRDSVMRPR